MNIPPALRQSARLLEKTSMAVMLLGLVMACQPFAHLLFSYSVTVMLLGLVAYNVFARIDSPKKASDRKL